MEAKRWRELADELAGRDPGLGARLRDAREAARALRDAAAGALDAFRSRASELGAQHLANVAVSEVEPDEKHVDCVQFRVARGRLELLCVAIAQGEGKVRLVGPFKRGKAEGPCSDHALRGVEVESALLASLERLVREAAGA
jgi:hypothetical protein